MLALAVGFFLLQTPGPVPAVDVWPQWRGPSGDSISPVPNLPTRWSKTENVVWSVDIPGWGNSTPAIWGDAIFVTTQAEDRLLLLRLNRKTGKVLWEREVGKGTPRRSGAVGNGRYHDENNMASPSPVTDGKYVWAHFGTGDLACYDFAGNKVWSLKMTERYGPYSIWWGHANSPVLHGDLLLCVCIQDPKNGGKNYVAALDKNTGEEKWFTMRESSAKEEPADSYTTPLLYKRGDRTELIVYGGQILDAYDPDSGKRLWYCNVFKGNRVISGPTLAGDTVYAVQGMKGPLFAVRAGGDGDVTQTHVRWKFTGGTPDAQSPLVLNGLVFMATNEGIASCVDATTGEILWKERLGRDFRATPLGAGDKVYFHSKEGKTTIVEASRTFKVLAENDLEENSIPSPAVAGGDLFIRTRGHLYRIGQGKERPLP
jgi:outer membrane protein assembly factor BamB